MKLGPRLAAIAAHVLPNARIADIGTDHGYLPAALIEQGTAQYAVAGDVHEGPLESARELINERKLADKISVRLGDGLAVVQPDEVDTVVIAGMGGTTMVHILSSGWSVTRQIRRLILQPMVGAGILRKWLVEHGFTFVQEHLVKEDGRIYEVIVAEPGAEPAHDPLVLEFGPKLAQCNDPLLREYWTGQLQHYQTILDSLQQSNLGTDHPKYTEYASKVNYLKEQLS